VGLQRGPLRLVSKNGELLERRSSGSGIKTENTVVRISHADHVVHPQKLALTLQTSGRLSVVIVRSVSKTRQLIYIYIYIYILVVTLVT
jgi:hypothetical protein